MIQIFMAWFYYSKFYMLGSILITIMLNKVFTKLYLPPLILNMVSVLLLFLVPVENRSYAMYFGYVPTVLVSVLLNLFIYIFRKKR